MEAVYCWSENCLTPAASIFFKRDGVCVGSKEIITRITIFGKQSFGPEYERQALIWLQHESSLIVYQFGATLESMVSKQISFLSSGFKFDNKTASFVWSKDEEAILPSRTTDAKLATLLGWTHLFDYKSKEDLKGIPPNVELPEGDYDPKEIEPKMISVPMWSEDLAQSVALLYELKEAYGFSHTVKKSGDFHFVSISDEESDVVSGAHSVVNGAIADALIRYLVECNNRESLKEKSHENPENVIGNV